MSSIPIPYLTTVIYFNLAFRPWGILIKLHLSVSETVALPWLSFPQKHSLSLFLNCHHCKLSHLSHMWLSEHIDEYNSLNLYKYIWIHPKSHCFLLSVWMLLVIAAFPLHNTTWGVWLAASGPLTRYKLTLIQRWISNCIHYKVWDKITYPFPNSNVCTVEVWEWLCNIIPHFIGYVITNPCSNQSWTMLVEWEPELQSPAPPACIAKNVWHYKSDADLLIPCSRMKCLAYNFLSDALH